MESKCPCCGESISEFELSGFWECDNCPFMCALEDFDRIAAAMAHARATVELENAMAPLNSGKMKMGEAMSRIRLAMEDERACEQRVLELFGCEK